METKTVIIISTIIILTLCLQMGIDEGIRKHDQEKRLADYCHTNGHVETLCAQ